LWDELNQNTTENREISKELKIGGKILAPKFEFEVFRGCDRKRKELRNYGTISMTSNG